MNTSNFPVLRIGFSRFCCLAVLVVLCACQSTPDDKTAEWLIGNWQFAQGQRDGRPTESLKGTFFEFKPNGEIFTNFNASAEPVTSPYTLKDKTISLEARVDDQPTAYMIERITPDSLQVRAELLGFDFQMLMLKRE